MKGKYIIFSDEVNETPVIFPAWVSHANVAMALKSQLGKPVSAGHFNGEDAYGESITLGIKSRAQDMQIIKSSIWED